MRRAAFASSVSAAIFILGCGGKLAAPDAVQGASDAASDAATGDADATVEGGGELDAGGAEASTDTLVAACRNAGNVVDFHGFWNATIHSAYWDVGSRAAYVRVASDPNASPFAELEFATDGIGIPLAVGTFPDTTASRIDGHPMSNLVYGSTVSDGAGSFEILDLAWSSDASRPLAAFTAVFVLHVIGGDEKSVVSGCVHWDANGP
jgi:hypothetical protein